MVCPLQDRFAELVEKRTPLQDEWRDALLRVIRWYFFQLMDAQRPTKEDLIDQWERIWFKNRSALEVMIRGVDQRTQWGVKGIKLLENFWRHVHPVPGRPLAVGERFTVPLGKVALTGELPLVREITEAGQRLVEIVHYRTGSVPNEMFWIESDLEVAFASWVFRRLYKGHEHRSRLVFLTDGKEVTLTVTDNLRQRLAHTLRCVLPGLVKGETWPRLGPHCRTCDYKDECIESWREV